MTILLFACERIRSRLSLAQCGHNWRAANSAPRPGSPGKFATTRVARRECVDCETGRAHAKGAAVPGIELIPAEALLRASRDERPKTTEDAMTGTAKFTDEQKADVVRRLNDGETATAIAASVGCSPTAVSLWSKGKTTGRPKASKRAKEAEVAREKAEQRAQRRAEEESAKRKQRLRAMTQVEKFRANHPDAVSLEDLDLDTPIPYTVANPSKFAHEDVIAFLARLPPMPWCLGDAIRLLAFHSIDGDFDDIHQARERIDAHLRARGEAA